MNYTNPSNIFSNMNGLNFNLNNCTSPGIPFFKYECSPIIALEKYKMLNRGLDVSGINRTSRLVNFQNGMTTLFKEADEPNFTLEEKGRDFPQNSKSGINESLVSHSQVIKIPINSTCNLFNSLSKESSLRQRSKSNLTSFPTFISSLKKSENMTNIYINYPVQAKKKLKLKKEVSFGNTSDWQRKAFRLDEILINGKTLNFLLDEQRVNLGLYELNPYVMEVVQPIYHKNFKLLNPFNEDFVERLPTENFLSEESEELFYTLIYTKKFRDAFLHFSLESCPKIYDKFTSYTKNSVKSNSLVKFYQKYVSRIKHKLISIQKDLSLRPRKEVNQILLKKLNSLVTEANLISNAFKKCLETCKKKPAEKFNVKSSLKQQAKRKKNVNYNLDNYDCKFCDRKFTTGQGLGGHMSRVHPNKSEQYKSKMEVRDSRTKQRELLCQAKRRLLQENGLEYDQLVKENKKKVIKQIIFKNRKEYRDILNELKREESPVQ